MTFFERNPVFTTANNPNPRRGRTIAALAGVLGLSLSGALVVVATGSASADAPTWTPADPNLVGEITLYDAAGAEVTSGSLEDGQIAAFAVGSTVPAGAGTTATLYAYTPVADGEGPLDPGEWTGYQLTGNTTAPASLPPGIPAGRPVVPISAGATTLGQYVAGYPSTVTAPGYAGIYELRLRTDGPGSANVQYNAVDILVNGTSWSVAGTDTSTATTTTLAVTPAGAAIGEPLTLTATVSPAAAGSVQFFDGTQSLGSGEVSGGTATRLTPALAGVHGYRAVFTPTDPTAYSASTSAVASYTVAPSATSTTLTAAPAAPKAGGALALKATVTPGVAGSVQFRDGSAALGAPVTVASGAASLATKVTKAGAHTYSAVFTPGDPTINAPSTGSRAVTAAKAASALKLTVAKKVKKTARAALTIVVTAPGLVATGTATIFDGAKKLGTVAIKAGKATYKLPKLKKGKHTIKVTYAGTADIAAAKAATAKVTSA